MKGYTEAGHISKEIIIGIWENYAKDEFQMEMNKLENEQIRQVRSNIKVAYDKLFFDLDIQNKKNRPQDGDDVEVNKCCRAVIALILRN